MKPDSVIVRTPNTLENKPLNPRYSTPKVSVNTLLLIKPKTTDMNNAIVEYNPFLATFQLLSFSNLDTIL